jgi:hypothetical protein
VNRVLTDAVDLLVDLRAVEITLLTRTCHGPTNASRMPRTNASNLAETLVGLAGQLGNVPTRDNTLETVTLGNTEDVDHLVLREDRLGRHMLLEQLVAEIDLVRNGATVDLDLENVGLLLADLNLGDLSVGDNTDDLAMLLDLRQLLLGVLRLLRLLLSVLCEGLLVLGLVPVLVEPSAELIGQMLGPDGGQGAKTARSLHIPDDSDNHHGRGLNDGNSLDGLLLVLLGTGLVNITSDVRHASLVAHEGGKVARLGGIIAGELPDATLVMGATLARKEAKRTMARAFELTVGHCLPWLILARGFFFLSKYPGITISRITRTRTARTRTARRQAHETYGQWDFKGHSCRSGG